MTDAEPEVADVDPLVKKLVSEVMAIERRYGHELRNVQSERRDGIREAIEKLSKGVA